MTKRENLKRPPSPIRDVPIGDQLGTLQRTVNQKFKLMQSQIDEMRLIIDLVQKQVDAPKDDTIPLIPSKPSIQIIPSIQPVVVAVPKKTGWIWN